MNDYSLKLIFPEEKIKTRISNKLYIFNVIIFWLFFDFILVINPIYDFLGPHIRFLLAFAVGLVGGVKIVERIME